MMHNFSSPHRLDSSPWFSPDPHSSKNSSPRNRRRSPPPTSQPTQPAPDSTPKLSPTGTATELQPATWPTMATTTITKLYLKLLNWRTKLICWLNLLNYCWNKIHRITWSSRFSIAFTKKNFLGLSVDSIICSKFLCSSFQSARSR